MHYGFGVDIYGEQTKIGFFDETGKLLDKWKVNTPMTQDGGQILPMIANELQRYMTTHHIFEDDVMGIGVGIPGPVNSSGVVNKCVNFGWGFFNINHALGGMTGLSVSSGNIANLAALGEYWMGNGSRNMAFVAMNTGLGGAVVCDGKVVFGAHGGGGELGHILLNREEKNLCTCGRRGCAEQYCSPSGIIRMAKRQLSGNLRPSVLRRTPITDFRQVVDAANGGDKIAKDVMAQLADYMGQLLATVCAVTNPDKIVLGGEFCHMNSSILEAVAKCFQSYVFPANKNVQFSFSKLGTDACLYGAFKIVLDDYNRRNSN